MSSVIWKQFLPVIKACKLFVWEIKEEGERLLFRYLSNMGIYSFKRTVESKKILSVSVALLLDVFPLPVGNNIRTAF